MDKELHVKQHSLSDWDIQPDSLVELDTTYYVSAPTSLAVPKIRTGYYEWTWVFLKSSVDGCIPHGLLCTWLWMPFATTNNPFFWVRAQALPPAQAGGRLPANAYGFYCTSNLLQIYRRVNDSKTVLLQQALANQLPERQWNHIAMFWETLTVGGSTFLRLTFQVKVNGVWITQGTCDDAQNLWEASAVNLVGFNISGSFLGNNPLYKGRVDDTEIWRRKT